MYLPPVVALGVVVAAPLPEVSAPRIKLPREGDSLYVSKQPPAWSPPSRSYSLFGGSYSELTLLRRGFNSRQDVRGRAMREM